MKYFYLLLTLLSSSISFAQNNIKSTGADTLKSQPSGNTAIRFFVGVNFNSFSSTISSPSDELRNSKASKSLAPGLSLGVDIPFDENHRWIFRTEAGITSTKDNFSYQYNNGSVTQINDALSLKESIINITPQVILNVVRTNAIDVYISSGLAINLRSYSSKQYTETTTYTVSGTTGTNSMQIPGLKSNTFCIPAKAGIVIAKSFNIYAAYNAKTSLNNDNQFSIDETLFTVGVNYILGR
ncbi:hypothetical protein [Mucilaginibacter sp.]